MHPVLFAAFTSFLHFNTQLRITESNATAKKYLHTFQDIEKLIFNYNETVEWCSMAGGKLPLLSNDTQLRKEFTDFPDVKIFLDIKPMDGVRINENEFTWSNGDKFNVTKWAEEEPNCSDTCCVVYFQNGEYYDASCSDGGSLFCDISSTEADFDVVRHVTKIMDREMAENKVLSEEANRRARKELLKNLKDRRKEVTYTRRRIMATRALKIVMVILCAAVLASMILTTISRKIPV